MGTEKYKYILRGNIKIEKQIIKIFRIEGKTKCYERETCSSKSTKPQLGWV